MAFQMGVKEEADLQVVVKEEIDDDNDSITTEEPWLMQIKQETPEVLEGSGIEDLLKEVAAREQGLAAHPQYPTDNDSIVSSPGKLCWESIRSAFNRKLHRPAAQKEPMKEAVVVTMPEKTEDSLGTAESCETRKSSVGDVGPYICLLCEKSFVTCRCRDEHTRTHPKPFPCHACHKSFHFYAALERHMQMHTNGMSLICEYCQKPFKAITALKHHKRMHTGEKPYACEHCQKSFVRKAMLISHKRKHTGERPYICEYCQKSFAERACLRRHRRTHTGEKPYTCEYCQRSFAAAGGLIEHRKTHTGEKPYMCDVCQKSFTQRGNFRKHFETHMRLPSYFGTAMPNEQEAIQPSRKRKSRKGHFRRTRQSDEVPDVVTIKEEIKEEDDSITIDDDWMEQIKQESLEDFIADDVHKLGSTGEEVMKVESPEKVDVPAAETDNQSCQSNFPSFESVQMKVKEEIEEDDVIPTEEIGREQIKLECPEVFDEDLDSDALDELETSGEEMVTIKPEIPEEVYDPLESTGTNNMGSQADGLWNVCKTAEKYITFHNLHCPVVNNLGTWSCDFCGMSFTTKGRLLTHRRKHTKPYICDFCQKQFSSHYGILKHVMTHTREKPFYCQYCTEHFSSKWQAIKHMTVHLGKFPFACNFCERSFYYRKGLERHLKLHGPERPFTCEYCQESYCSLAALNNHKRKEICEKHQEVSHAVD